LALVLLPNIISGLINTLFIIIYYNLLNIINKFQCIIDRRF